MKILQQVFESIWDELEDAGRVQRGGHHSAHDQLLERRDRQADAVNRDRPAMDQIRRERGGIADGHPPEVRVRADRLNRPGAVNMSQDDVTAKPPIRGVAPCPILRNPSGASMAPNRRASLITQGVASTVVAIALRRSRGWCGAPCSVPSVTWSTRPSPGARRPAPRPGRCPARRGFAALGDGILFAQHGCGWLEGYAEHDVFADQHRQRASFGRILQHVTSRRCDVLDDQTGRVDDLTLSYTYIDTGDGRLMIVPNEQVVTHTVFNRSTGTSGARNGRARMAASM